MTVLFDLRIASETFSAINLIIWVWIFFDFPFASDSMFCTYEHLHVPAFSWIAKSQTSTEDNLFVDLSKWQHKCRQIAVPCQIMVHIIPVLQTNDKLWHYKISQKTKSTQNHIHRPSQFAKESCLLQTWSWIKSSYNHHQSKHHEHGSKSNF